MGQLLQAHRDMAPPFFASDARVTHNPLLPSEILDQLKGIYLGKQTTCFLLESLPVAALHEIAIAGVKEAARTLDWLEEAHPTWWPSFILDRDTRRDVRMTALAREGARAVSTARLAVSSYDTFIASQQGMATNALDVDVLLLYLHSVNTCAKDKRVKSGKIYKGSAAQARLKGLKSAVSLLGAPFDLIALQSRFTASAVLRPETPAVTVTSAHISAEAVAAIEDIALGAYYEAIRGHAPPATLPQGPVAVEVARNLQVATIASLRLDDLRKTQVVAVHDETFTIEIQGPKSPKHTKRKVVTVIVPFSGITPGMGVWGPAWAKSKIGQSFVFSGFSPQKGGALAAASISLGLIPARYTTPVLRELVGAALEMDVTVLQRHHLTGHAPRHFLTEVATAALWQEEEIDYLGRWAPGERDRDSKTRARSSSAAYATGITTQELELRLRKKAIALVTDFIGTSNWKEKLPVQRLGLISFDFISEAQEEKDDISEFSSSSDEAADSEAALRPPAVPLQSTSRGKKGSRELTQRHPARAGRACT
jgi:hypothetical protein